MKSNKLFLIFFILIAAVTFTTAQNSSEREVRQMERAWLNAYEQKDSKAMEAIVADNFMITFPDGRIQTKPQILEMLRQSRNAPPLKFYTEDVQARVYGDTVILTGRVVTEWQQKGQAMKEENRYTDTYVKRDGRWQVVASHLSNVPKAQNQDIKAESQSTKAVRKAIEAWYEQNTEAFRKKDAAAIMALRADDFYTVLPDGKRNTRADMQAYTDRLLGMIEKFETLDFQIGALELQDKFEDVQGEFASADVTQKTVRTQRLQDGQIHKVESGAVQRETWKKTADGWKLYRVDNIRDAGLYIDGNLVRRPQ